MVPLLKIDDPVDCIIVSRLNRFVVEVEVRGARYHASINNTGRLPEFLLPGRRGFCVRYREPLKTDFRLFAVEDSAAYATQAGTPVPPDASSALIDTQLQMAAFEKALDMGLIPWLEGQCMVKRNARLGDSLIDYLLEGRDGTTHLEVKSAALREGSYAMYPDCPTARGRKHIRELTEHVKNGGKAVILFMAALPAVTGFKPNRPADPELYELLVKAQQAGVLLKALNITYEAETSSISLLDPDLGVEMG